MAIAGTIGPNSWSDSEKIDSRSPTNNPNHAPVASPASATRE